MAVGEKAKIIQGFGQELCKVANDRTRLQIAFEQTLNKVGLPKKQIIKIIADVRRAEFTSLQKALRIDRK